MSRVFSPRAGHTSNAVLQNVKSLSNLFWACHSKNESGFRLYKSVPKCIETWDVITIDTCGRKYLTAPIVCESENEDAEQLLFAKFRFAVEVIGADPRSSCNCGVASCATKSIFALAYVINETKTNMETIVLKPKGRHYLHNVFSSVSEVEMDLTSGRVTLGEPTSFD